MTTDQASRGRSWWPIAVYPAAFPLTMVLLIWGEAEINVMELIRPASIAVAAALQITLVISILAGDRRLGEIAATAAVLALVVDRVEASLLLAAVAVFLIAVARIGGGGASRYLPTATKVLRLIATIALVAAAIALAGRPGFIANIEEAFIAAPGPSDRPMPPAGSPDMFVYLIDGYPGATAAAQVPTFDAEAFPAALRDRGFTVHADARTNYLLTRLVIPTMFDVRHVTDIPELAAPFGPDQSQDARRLRTVTERSAGLAAIREAGYDVMWVSSGWSHMDVRNVDRRIEAPGPSELEIGILRQTGAGSLLQLIDPNGFANVHRDRAHAAFEAAVALAAEPHDRPRFVFVHVPVPHSPNVFRADGSAEDGSPDTAWDTYAGNPESQESQERRRERTFAQVQAVGRLTLDGIDALRAASTAEPVIVLFSDHGTDLGFDAGAPLTSDLSERVSAIVAASTPGHPGLFASPTTPINLIGTLTNAYLGTSFARQPDVTYAYDGSVLNVVPVETTPGD